MKTILLRNQNGMEAEVLPFGGILRRLRVPDVHGVPTDVVIGFSDPEDYRDNPCFLGGTVGPLCNRTRDGVFELDGVTYRIPQNAGGHNLHSDHDRGFHKREWEVTDEGASFVTMRLPVPDGDLGFPGNREVTLRMSLGDDQSFHLQYEAVTDKKTVFNLTHHDYFNLDGAEGKEITGHRARFFSSAYTPMGDGMLTTGEIRDVTGTPFDFRTEKRIGKDIDADDPQLAIGAGFDHSFFVDGYDGTLRPCVEITGEKSGIRMEVLTTLPAFQFYAGNFFDCPSDLDGRARGRRHAFCIETQFPPDALHHPAFPQPVWTKEKPFRAETVLRFSTAP